MQPTLDPPVSTGALGLRVSPGRCAADGGALCQSEYMASACWPHTRRQRRGSLLRWPTGASPACRPTPVCGTIIQKKCNIKCITETYIIIYNTHITTIGKMSHLFRTPDGVPIHPRGRGNPPPMAAGDTKTCGQQPFFCCLFYFFGLSDDFQKNGPKCRSRY